MLSSVLGSLATATATTAFQGGYSGLIRTPTAEIAPAQKATIGYRYLAGTNKLVVNYGMDGNLELGLTGLSWLENEDSELALNAKLKLLAEDSRQPALAVGLIEEDLYLAVSQSLNYFGLRAHIGVGNGRFENIFGGITKTINPVSILTEDSWFQLPITTLIFEYDGADFNFGADFKMSSQLDLNLALNDFSELGAGVTFSNRF